MNKVGRLELIIGPMFSGKSSEIIRRIRLFEVINKKVLAINFSGDTRYSDKRIVSHNKEQKDCLMLDDLISISDETLTQYDVIVVDEGQFFKNLKSCILHWVDTLKLHVIVSGLDGDFKRNPIGEILLLIPYADKYKKMTALCKYCNDETPALFTHRLTHDNCQIVIGNDIYVALCRNHYLELNK